MAAVALIAGTSETAVLVNDTVLVNDIVLVDFWAAW